jgi:penicillin-binding protein 2
VLNEHSGFGASNAAPTASAVVKKWMELRAEDAAERAGPVPAPATGVPAPAPVPPPKPPGAPERPQLGALPRGRGRGA